MRHVLFQLRMLLLTTLAPALVGSRLVQAQTSPDTIGPELRTLIVQRVADVLEREYVLPEVAARMAARIQTQLAAGAYADLGSPQAFAAALTRDLREIYLDRHLAVLPPARFEAFRSAVSGDHGREQHDAPPAAVLETRVMNRDGRTDVGFLRIQRFDGSVAGLAAIDSAMRQLTGVAALILDLRSSPGGDADAVKALSSYFFADSTHLVNSIGPRDASGRRPVSERWTAPNPLSPQFAQVPIYLLINGETFSAAESFAFGMQRTGRATLVGQATGGGGHMNAPFALPGGFGASISVGRTYDPRTGEGWQSTGVVPTVQVESDHAMETALRLVAREAEARAALAPDPARVFATLQQFAEAWYHGRREAMREVLDSLFGAHHVTTSGALVRFDASALVAQADSGLGRRTPRELRNRIITVFDVYGDIASARLVLRDTVHEMHLRRVDGTWRIVDAVVTAKPRHA